MAAAVPVAAAAAPAAASAFSNPAVLSSLFSALGPLFSGLMGDKGGAGSSFDENQLGFISDMIKKLKSQNSDITQDKNYQQGSEWLSKLFNDPEFFKSFEAPLMRQFEEDIVPGLANRFAGMGSGGSTGSTAFRNQLGREGSNLSTNIAALRGGMQQQGVNQGLQYAQQPVSNYMQMLQQALRPTQNTYQQASF